MSDTKQPVQIDELLLVMTDQLAGLAWSKLGLQPDPITGEVKEDFAQARLAIDAVSALIDLLEPSMEEEDRRQAANLKANLKINFAQRAGNR